MLCCDQSTSKSKLEEAFETEPLVRDGDKAYWKAVFAKEHNNLEGMLYHFKKFDFRQY